MSDRNPTWWNRFGRVVEEYDKSLYDKAVLRRIATTQARNLLVEGRWDEEKEAATDWLLDQDGQVLGTAVSPIESLNLSPHYLLFLLPGEDGETLVHALERPQDEVTGSTACASGSTIAQMS